MKMHALLLSSLGREAFALWVLGITLIGLSQLVSAGIVIVIGLGLSVVSCRVHCTFIVIIVVLVRCAASMLLLLAARRRFFRRR